MNSPLKEYPHLFANGEFKIKIQGEGTYNIELLDGIWLDRFKRYGMDNITLIARPIEDMTDEEIKNTLVYHKHKDAGMSFVNDELKYGSLSSSDFLYLLSIGVYPFDQQAFENGTVIDATTI